MRGIENANDIKTLRAFKFNTDFIMQSLQNAQNPTISEPANEEQRKGRQKRNLDSKG